MHPRALLPLCVAAACAAPPDGDALAEHDALGAGALLGALEALQAVADDHGGSRALGTSGYAASVALVVDRLEGLGLSPRTEPFDVTSWVADEVAVTWDGGAVEAPEALAWSGSGSATGHVVGVDLVLPPGARADTSTSGCEPQDFDAFPAGAVAVLQRGTCTFARKAALAEAAGAVAVVVGNEGQPGRDGPLLGSLDEDDPPGVPVVGVDHAVMVALLDVTAPVTVVVGGEVEVVPSENVRVDLPGRGPGTWVIGAHLDSVSGGPGINDNGTGVVALLQLAEVLAAAGEAEHGVCLAFWGAEEVGLVGSTAHVEGLDAGALDDLLGYVNVDMIGSPNPGRFVYDGAAEVDEPAARETSAALRARFEAWFAARDLPTLPTVVGGRSDHAAFAARGVPVGGLYTGAEEVVGEVAAARFGALAGAPFDPCYHRACDDLDNVDLGALEAMARALAGVVGALREDGLAPR